MMWQAQVVQELMRRAKAAPSAIDRAALVREAARVNGGEITVDVDLAGVDPERFGITCNRTGTAWKVVHLGVPRHAPGFPGELARSLGNVLPVDVHTRRADERVPADGVLCRHSPHRDYRNATQRAAVRAMCTMPPGGVLLARMSTGTGKSLLFQLGARYWRGQDPGACVVVLVPTIALALDQEKAAREVAGLEEATSLTSQDKPAARADKVERFRQGRIPLLFLSPEMALGSFRPALAEAALPPEHPSRPLAAKARLAAVFVDEVHIVASWGQAFRPDLQRIAGLVATLTLHQPQLRTVLLSATVDGPTRELLRVQYASGKPFLEIAERSPRREFEIVRHCFPDGDTRDHVLTETLVDLLPRPAIIYTTRVDHAQGIAQRLRDRGYQRVADFTGETDAANRDIIVRQWRSGELDLVIATSAFGMGIDQAFTRCVVHACLTEGASRYYQEIGRAGRDGHQAFALLLDAPDDVELAHRMASGRTLREKAPPRWLTMLQTRQVDPTDTERRRLRFDLGASGDGDRNLTWNRSLLVQLQRYGAVEVYSAPDDQDAWTVTPSPAHSDLFQTDTAAAAIHHLLDTKRAAEEAEARAGMAAFTAAWEGDGFCLVGCLFPLIEEGVVDPQPCGRCLACRSMGGGRASTVDRGSRLVRWPTDLPVEPGGVLRVPAQEVDHPEWTRWLFERGVRQLIAAKADVAPKLREAFNWFTPIDQLQDALRVPSAMFLVGGSAQVESYAEAALAWARQTGVVRWWVLCGAVTLHGRDLEVDVSDRAPLQLPAVASRGNP